MADLRETEENWRRDGRTGTVAGSINGDLFKEQEVFMEQNKVQLFEDQPIRTAWDEEGEE